MRAKLPGVDATGESRGQRIMQANAVSTIVDILRRAPEPLPGWLDGDSPPRFDRETFSASRTVYQPGSGDDGQSVKPCALSHAAHNFICVD